MGVGTLRTAVIDVTDLAVAEAFWSELTGLAVLPAVFAGRYGYIGHLDPWQHELILHLVGTDKGSEANRAHVDIGVRDIDLAIPQIEPSGDG